MKGGRGEVARRFNALGQRQDWGGIVERWEADMKRTASRKPLDRVRRKPDEEEQKARLRREVVSLINGGKISKEMQIITSNGVASIDDPNVLDMLKSKYPDRGRAIPGRVTWG